MIYLTQQSADQDDLLIWDEWLDIGAIFILRWSCSSCERESCAGAPRYGGREKSRGTGNEGISSQFPSNKKYQIYTLSHFLPIRLS